MNELVVGFVPGVTPRKWFGLWAERMPGTPLRGQVVQEHEQLEALCDGRVRMCLVRLPLDSEEHHLIPLYEEVPVVVVPADHVVTAVDEVTHADIADELVETPDVMPWADRVAVVAGGAGLLVAPMSVARELHRKDLAWRPVSDLPATRVGLAWRKGDDDPLIETFVGIVRGRTARSSRSPAPTADPVRTPKTPARKAPAGSKRRRRRR